MKNKVRVKFEIGTSIPSAEIFKDNPPYSSENTDITLHADCRESALKRLDVICNANLSKSIKASLSYANEAVTKIFDTSDAPKLDGPADISAIEYRCLKDPYGGFFCLILDWNRRTYIEDYWYGVA